MAIPLEDDELYTIAEAAAYLNVARSSVYNYEKRGQLTPVLKEGIKHWRRSELDTIEPYLDREIKGRPPRKQQAAAEVFEQALARVTNGQTPEQLMRAMGSTDTSSMRDIATQLQRYLARPVLEFHAVEVLGGGPTAPRLESPAFSRGETAGQDLAHCQGGGDYSSPGSQRSPPPGAHAQGAGRDRRAGQTPAGVTYRADLGGGGCGGGGGMTRPAGATC